MDDESNREDQVLNESEICRPPTVEDLLSLCREFNQREAKYLLVGGFAIRGAGYLRETYDLDFLIAADLENEAKIYAALATLPDKAVLELKPGEVAQYTVVRIADEIMVDLMQSASGIDYEEASKEIVMRRVGDVEIPFASPRLLWRMKKNTHREKDIPDLLFLRQQYPEVVDE